MTPPQLGFGLALPHTQTVGAALFPYLVDWRFTQGIPADFAALHSRDSGAMTVSDDGLWKWAPENFWDNPVMKPDGATIPYWYLGRCLVSDPEVNDPEGNPVIRISYDTNETGTARLQQNISELVAGMVYEFSFVVKADGASSPPFFVNDNAGGQSRHLDLPTGVLSGSDTVEFSDTAVEDMGDGFYRYKTNYTAPVTGTRTFWIPSFDAGEYLIGSASFRRLPSAGRLRGDSGAGPFYSPRLTHDPVTLEPLGYLHEPQATNLEDYSSFQSGWTLQGGSFSSQTEQTPVSAIGSMFTEDATTGLHRIFASISWTSGTDYVISFRAKMATGGRRYIALTHPAAASAQAIFDLQTGSTVSIGGDVLQADMIEEADGFWLCYLSTTSTVTGNQSYIIASNGSAGSIDSNIAGLNGDAFIIDGAQVEAGFVFPSSPIITNGAAAIRQTDSLSKAVFTRGVTKGGTVIVDMELLANNGGASVTFFDLNDGAVSDSIRLDHRIKGTNSLRGINTEDGNTSVCTFSPVPQFGEPFKAGFSVDSVVGNRRVALDGVAGLDIAMTPWVWNDKLNELTFLSTLTGCIVSSLRVIPKASTMAELQTLTAP